MPRFLIFLLIQDSHSTFLRINPSSYSNFMEWPSLPHHVLDLLRPWSGVTDALNALLLDTIPTPSAADINSIISISFPELSALASAETIRKVVVGLKRGRRDCELDVIVRMLCTSAELGTETLPFSFRCQLRAAIIILLVQKYLAIQTVAKNSMVCTVEAAIHQPGDEGRLKEVRYVIRGMAQKWQLEAEEKSYELNMSIWRAVVEGEANLGQRKEALKVRREIIFISCICKAHFNITNSSYPRD